MILEYLKKTVGGRRRDEAMNIEHADFRVLFVCMGNICRSPTVEGVFRRVAKESLPGVTLHIDSAGTHAYHVGEPPDKRAQAAALRRGIDISSLRARRVAAGDYERFDLILAMDPLNVAVLKEHCPSSHHDRIRLLLEFVENPSREDVPDPYYGGAKGFEYVLDLAEEAAAGLAAHISGRLGRP